MRGTLDDRQFRDDSPESPEAKQQALFDMIPTLLSELSLSRAGEFVAIHSAGAYLAPTREEADDLARQYTPRIVLEVPTQQQLASRARSKPEPTVHRRNIEVLDREMESLQAEYPGLWVAIHDGRVVGVDADRHALIAEYYRDEYLPVLFAKIAGETGVQGPVVDEQERETKYAGPRSQKA